MRRILLAWEIGGGFGHLARLIPLARYFQQRGDHVEIAVRDPEALRSATRPAPLSGRLAPHLAADTRSVPVSLNYADALRRNGYLDPLAVRTVIEHWTAVIDDVRPDLVVMDHAPGALLAASLRRLPRIVIGSGFTVPPLDTPQPTTQPWFAVAGDMLEAREKALLAAVNPAMRSLGGSPFASVAGFFDGAERCICTWPELDHYDDRPADTFIGPLNGVEGTDVSWPQGDGPRVFFYGQGPRLMEALDIAIARGCRIVVGALSAPADLGTLAASADLVVCNAPGTATRFLIAGVPALLLPNHREQELWAYRVCARGLAKSTGMFSRGASDRIAVVFDEALTSTILRSQVQTWAANRSLTIGRDPFALLADRCEALL